MTAINLKLLQTFLAAVESGSFRQAAKDSNRAPSAISMQIRDLEEQIGISLFIRTRQRTELTPDGRMLYESVSKSMGDIRASIDHVADLVARRKGRIRIACAPTLAATRLAGILATFKLRYPHSHVEVIEVSPQAAVAMIQRQEIEFYIGPELAEPADLPFEPILEDPLHACVPREFDEGHTALGIRDLARHPLILLNRTTAARALLDRLAKAQDIELSPQYEVAASQTALSLAKAGLGICVLPRISIVDAAPAIRVVPIDPSHGHRWIGLLTAPGNVPHSYSERLKDIFRDALAASN